MLRYPSLRASLDVLFLVCCIALTADVVAPEIWGNGKTKDYPLWFWAGQQVLQGRDLYPGDPHAYFGFIYPPLSAVLLAIPGALLVGYAFAAAGLAVTTYLRDFSDFQLIQLVMLPMFLFATTFYPLSIYPGWARPVVEILPLYQSIQLLREPALGAFHWDIAVAALYLAAFGSLALAHRHRLN